MPPITGAGPGRGVFSAAMIVRRSLDSRKRRPETQVTSGRKREVSIALAIEHQRVGLRKLRRIAMSRTDEQVQLLASSNLAICDVDVRRGNPGGHLQRSVVA